jgi:hypothetical protein
VTLSLLFCNTISGGGIGPSYGLAPATFGDE